GTEVSELMNCGYLPPHCRCDNQFSMKRHRRATAHKQSRPSHQRHGLYRDRDIRSVEDRGFLDFHAQRCSSTFHFVKGVHCRGLSRIIHKDGVHEIGHNLLEQFEMPCCERRFVCSDTCDVATRII